MRSLVPSMLVVSAIGAVHAVRRDRRCRCLGIPFPGPAALHALTLGSAMSAPPAMLVALAVSARPGREATMQWLSGLMIAGILSEPNTWETLHHPRADQLSTTCVMLEIALPAALLWDAHRSQQNALDSDEHNPALPAARSTA